MILGKHRGATEDNIIAAKALNNLIRSSPLNLSIAGVPDQFVLRQHGMICRVPALAA
jgi:hypothetical protein